MYDMMIDIGLNFLCTTIPQGQVHGLRIFMLKFYFKGFKTSLFPNHLMDLVYVWYMYEDTDWLNILHGTIPTPYMISGSRAWT